MAPTAIPRGTAISTFVERISLTSGPPDQQATLVPDVSTKRSIAWKLSDKDEYWVACHYLFTNLLLTRKLPHGMRECSVKLLAARRRPGGAAGPFADLPIDVQSDALDPGFRRGDDG